MGVQEKIGVGERRLFSVEYVEQPWRNRSFLVRGICRYDVLNPCWDNRPSDIPGEHWGGGSACVSCTRAAAEAERTEQVPA